MLNYFAVFLDLKDKKIQLKTLKFLIFLICLVLVDDFY